MSVWFECAHSGPTVCVWRAEEGWQELALFLYSVISSTLYIARQLALELLGDPVSACLAVGGLGLQM